MCEVCGAQIHARMGRPPKACDDCRNRPRQQHHRPGQTELVESWKRSVADGTAGARCDELVRRRIMERGIPMALADAIIGAGAREQAA